MIQLNINKAFQEAWGGFKGWWIPLCIISTIILFSQSWLPKWLLSNELSKFEPYHEAYQEFKSEIIKSPFQIIEINNNYLEKNIEITLRPETGEAIWQLVIKGLSVIGILFFFGCILHVFMIIFAKASVQKNKKDITVKKDFSKSFYLSLSYALLAVIKIVPLFFCILPGIYIYIKLYYTGFIITEESANPLASISKSWKMTEGNFFPVFFIFCITLAVNIITYMTIIGIIPGSSFNYTLRAASYEQLKNVPQASRLEKCESAKG